MSEVPPASSWVDLDQAQHKVRDMRNEEIFNVLRTKTVMFHLQCIALRCKIRKMALFRLQKWPAQSLHSPFHIPWLSDRRDLKHQV